MSLVMDFELAWKPFEDKLTSYIAKQTSQNEMIEPEDFTSFYHRSLRMWEDPARVQSGFLNKWKTVSPALEKDFMDILRRFRFEQPQSGKKVSPVLFAVIMLIVTIAGAAAGYLLPKTGFLKSHLGNIAVIMIGAIVFAVVGGNIVKAVYDNAVGSMCRDAAGQYHKQLQALHDKLLALCKQVS